MTRRCKAVQKAVIKDLIGPDSLDNSGFQDDLKPPSYATHGVPVY